MLTGLSDLIRVKKTKLPSVKQSLEAIYLLLSYITYHCQEQNCK